jgi:uncharacterized protein YciI
MKISSGFTVATILLLFSVGNGQEPATPQPATKQSSYDAELAKKVGADEYGMKTFVFATLKRGSAKVEDPKELKQLQAGHLQNINRLAKEGKMVLAGPFLDNQDVRGIFIFDVPTIDEAKKLVETDPAVKSGLFEFDLRLWYGSAGLLKLLEIHDKVAKKKIFE